MCDDLSRIRSMKPFRSGLLPAIFGLNGRAVARP